MSDPQLNNYIYQNLFALNESLKKDHSPENIHAVLARNKVLGNMIRQEAIDIALRDRHAKSRLLPYLPDMFEQKMENLKLEPSHNEDDLDSKEKSEENNF